MAIDATAVQNLPNVLCIDKCTPIGRQLAVLIALACQWGGINPDPTALQANAACFDKCIPTGMRMGVLISLAEQLVSPGAPPAPPATCSYTPVNPEVQSFVLTQCQISTGVCRTVGNLPVAKALDTLVTNLKAAGVWGMLDAVYPFVGGTAASCAVNLVNPELYQITWHGGVTFLAAGGVTFDGSSGYGDTGFNPNTAVAPNFTLGSASVGVYCANSSVPQSTFIGASTALALDDTKLEIVGAAPTTMQGRVNQSTTAISSGNNPPTQGNCIVSRTNGITLSIYLPDGSSFTNSSATSALTSFPIAIACLNQGGTPLGFFGGTLNLAFIGAGLTPIKAAAVQAAVTTYANTPGVPGCP